jgi:hypothetical protein
MSQPSWERSTASTCHIQPPIHHPTKRVTVVLTPCSATLQYMQRYISPLRIRASARPSSSCVVPHRDIRACFSTEVAVHIHFDIEIDVDVGVGVRFGVAVGGGGWEWRSVTVTLHCILFNHPPPPPPPPTELPNSRPSIYRHNNGSCRAILTPGIPVQCQAS